MAQQNIILSLKNKNPNSKQK